MLDISLYYGWPVLFLIVEYLGHVQSLVFKWRQEKYSPGNNNDMVENMYVFRTGINQKWIWTFVIGLFPQVSKIFWNEYMANSGHSIRIKLTEVRTIHHEPSPVGWQLTKNEYFLPTKNLFSNSFFSHSWAPSRW